jgi:hypothetical protein
MNVIYVQERVVNKKSVAEGKELNRQDVHLTWEKRVKISLKIPRYYVDAFDQVSMVLKWLAIS